MIDLEPFIGKFEWQTINITDAEGFIINTFVRPDMMVVFRFIILCLMIRYFLKAIFAMVSFFR